MSAETRSARPEVVDDAAQVRVEHLRSDEVRTFELVVLVGDAGPVARAIAPGAAPGGERTNGSPGGQSSAEDALLKEQRPPMEPMKPGIGTKIPTSSVASIASVPATASR